MEDNKTSHIKYIQTAPHTPEWHQFRYDNGFGGSEIASVVSAKTKTLADLVYTPALKMHLLKIGEPIQDFTGNVESESGHYFEPIILNMYRHYDMENPDCLQMYRNIPSGLQVNSVETPKVYVQNEKWPWLYYSPDGFGKLNMVGPDRLLECKHTTSMEARRYKHKVSPSFYCQVQQGLMLTELDHADLLIFIDGKWFEPITIEPDKQWFDIITDTSYQAWRNVLEARKIKIEYGIQAYFGMNPDFFTEKQKEGIMKLSELEPDMSGTDAELSFVKELVIPSVEEVVKEGTEETLKLCLKYLSLGDQVKATEKEQQAIYEQLLLHIGAGSNVCNFDGQKLFTYKADKRGTCRLLVNNELKLMYSDFY
jgi:hypothetical protein